MTRSSFATGLGRRFARDEQGVVSVQNLFLLMACCAIGAVGLDVTHFYAAKTQLQISADLAAHSALYTSRYGAYSNSQYYPLTQDAARDAAIAAVQFGMPESLYETVIQDSTIVLGTFDHATGHV